MKKWFYISLLLGSLSFTSGDVVVQFEHENVLYLGLPNPLHVTHTKYPCEKLVLKMEPDSVVRLSKLGCGEYVASPLKRVKEGITLKVYKNKVSERNLLHQEKYAVHKVPTPSISVNGFKSGTLSHSDWSQLKKLQVGIENFYWSGMSMEVTSFDYIFKPKTGTIFQGTNWGSFLRGELLARMSNAKSGDMLIIFGISYRWGTNADDWPVSDELVFRLGE